MTQGTASADEASAPARAGSRANEAALIAAVQAGDQRAAADFVRRYGARMLATANRVLGDTGLAEDCVQDAFLTAFRNLDRFEGRAGVATWLHRITVNAAVMILRKRRRKAEQSIDDLLPVFDEDGFHSEPVWGVTRPVDELVADSEARALVIAKIAELPENYRIVLTLRDIEEMDTAETADALEISEAAVKVRLHRARAALRTLLQPLFAGSGP